MSSVSAIGLICPHCNVALPSDWSRPRAARCPTCRLLIAADRASSPDGPGGERRSSRAAGGLADAARRADVAGGDPDLILAALQNAATERGVPASRLRMLDYELFARRRPAAPTLAIVIATFTTWTSARLRAAERR